MLTALLLLTTVHTPRADSLRARPSIPAIPASRASAPASSFGIADSLVLNKREHRLTLYAQGRQIRTYLVALGTNPVGQKTRRGDGRTPEGLYHIDNHNPTSKYHLSLHISYPNATDRERATRGGFAPGGDVMIHGLPDQFASVGALHRQQDWTLGCVAVTNNEIEEIWRAVPDGTPILIVPE
jgi:murein L,D-transpeptidase YafK